MLVLYSSICFHSRICLYSSICWYSNMNGPPPSSSLFPSLSAPALLSVFSPVPSSRPQLRYPHSVPRLLSPLLSLRSFLPSLAPLSPRSRRTLAIILSPPSARSLSPPYLPVRPTHVRHASTPTSYIEDLYIGGPLYRSTLIYGNLYISL